MTEGWRYYNGALVPVTPPHIDAVVPQDKNAFWRSGNEKALFARYTTDFDCGFETEWWYIIKDTRFNIDELKAKRRYEVNKGKKNFEVREIKAEQYPDAICEISEKAYLTYPEKYRPVFDREKFKSELPGWKKHTVYGAFERETDRLCAYSWFDVHEAYMDFCVLKTMPEHEKQGVNAAVVEQILCDFSDKLNDGFYICDGARALFHETAFQDYLEKYFGFRKAYCMLHMEYAPFVGAIVKMLMPFRKLIRGRSRVFSKVKAVLDFEDIAQKCIKQRRAENERFGINHNAVV